MIVLENHKIFLVQPSGMNPAQGIRDRPTSICKLKIQELLACKIILAFAEVKQATAFVMLQLRQEIGSAIYIVGAGFRRWQQRIIRLFDIADDTPVKLEYAHV